MLEIGVEGRQYSMTVAMAEFNTKEQMICFLWIIDQDLTVLYLQGQHIKPPELGLDLKH